MAQDIFQLIQQQIDENRVVLYMKGTPALPQCGFSQMTSEILKRLGVEFQTYDVLQDAALREGIKQFSNWPTIPQLYVKGEFVGGCDIVREMYASGELSQFMREKGVPTAEATA